MPRRKKNIELAHYLQHRRERSELAEVKRAMEQYLCVEIDDQYAHAALTALRLYNNSNHCI